MTERNFGATVAQILVNLNEGFAIEPKSHLHRDLSRTFDQFITDQPAGLATMADVQDRASYALNLSPGGAAALVRTQPHAMTAAQLAMVIVARCQASHAREDRAWLAEFNDAMAVVQVDG